ncbi:hypothetical protein RRG08_024744 [Elysia crispata]|uniref:Uncharacterized protein n=1 Tax=Elysia crispata TaxID=231223 RepID=A0AAE1CWY8_9GAST|nr:hypothetical protein RRG08_024744 [Elysia crispata]
MNGQGPSQRFYSVKLYEGERRGSGINPPPEPLTTGIRSSCHVQGGLQLSCNEKGKNIKVKVKKMSREDVKDKTGCRWLIVTKRCLRL